MGMPARSRRGTTASPHLRVFSRPARGIVLATSWGNPRGEAMSNQIVLDPGHGGTQRRGNSSPEGARLGNGLLEKQVNLALAQQVARHLPGASLTRGDRDNPSLGERIELARRRGAQAFVSLHTNPQGAAPGTDVWIHDRAGPESLQLAQRIG